MAYRSDPMCTIQENKLLSAMKMILCYSYLSSGTHTKTSTNKAALIKFYGIGKGAKVLLAYAYLETTAGYLECQPAAAMIIGLPADEFSYITFEIDTTETDFWAIHGQAQLVFTVQGGTDDPSVGMKIKAIRPVNGLIEGELDVSVET